MKAKKRILVCEAPGKVKKLSQYAGAQYEVIPTVGHLRELSKKGPDSLGFSFDVRKKTVNCDYVPRSQTGTSAIARLKEAIKDAEAVILATDEDREGESIAWHVCEALGLARMKLKVERVTFTEITQTAVQRALANPRQIDMNLVSSARARQCLDRLVGFKLSPLLWQMRTGAKSAGRVQSAALHLLAERERQIAAFIPQDYWIVRVIYACGDKKLEALYAPSHSANNWRGATGGEDSDRSEDEPPETACFRLATERSAQKIVEAARSARHIIQSIESTEQIKKPPAPFTTSTLQQEAGTKLGLSTQTAMAVAQKLYEEGLISYHRTDSVMLSEEFCDAARAWLKKNNPNNVTAKGSSTQHKNRASAQEAHEAIRPTDPNCEPKKAFAELGAPEAKLYDLIWRRAIASQCQPARIQQTRVTVAAGELRFEFSGKVIKFRGYGEYWNDLGTDSELPPLVEGKELIPEKIESVKCQTKPPSRYSEPGLVSLLERKGIGRPSTFASIISTLFERGYVMSDRKKLIPTDLGMEVDEFLGRVVPDVIAPGFTAELEADLDKIAWGQLNWETWLIDWNARFFQPAVLTGQKILKCDYAVKDDERVKQSCQNCGHSYLIKRYSHSQNLKADHYLLCPECQVAHFLTETGEYELPANVKRQKNFDPSLLSDRACPACGAKLEKYLYVKEGQQKVMLRCHDYWTAKTGHAKSPCKTVSFYQSKTGGWWSPKYGELPQEGLPDFSQFKL